jgi:arginine/lysine/ornithine decarboxylase
MFHQFFGENMLRADVCNAVDELGQLLDHTGPVAASERNAARIFNADHLFFVTNGTSTSNKMVWHSTVAPGDIVVVDRNCHKSILHSIIMTGAMPVFLTPTRNHYGIIGPIPLEEFSWRTSAKIEANPSRAKAKNKKPRILTITQSTYDGILYNVEAIKEMLDGRDRHPALRRGLAAARRLPRLLRRLSRHRRRPSALQGVDGFRDPVDAQAAGRPLARPRRSWCRTRRPASSTATSSTRPT